MQQNSVNPDNKNIIVGSDYGQLIRLHTNGAIVEAFISLLFSRKTKFNLGTIVIILRNISILLFIKILLEDSKSYLDQFKFTNLSFVKYTYQQLWYSTVKYEIILVGNRWMFQNKLVSINTLTPFLEQKSIYPSQPGIYYYYVSSYLVKVLISDKKIIFSLPNIASMVEHMNNVIHKNEEIIYGNKTIMSKINVPSSNIIKLEPMRLVNAFPTSNYKNLEESITCNFIVDSLLKFPSPPFCINFDGEPGTGKTTFGSYIATSGIFDRIIICNLMQATSMNFQEFITNLERQIINTSCKKTDVEHETILIIFDEIDKWLKSFTENQIHKIRDESHCKKQCSDNTQMVEICEKLTEKEEEEKKIHYHVDFLDQLYKLVDGHMLSDIRKYVIIFNTNDFTSLFSGMDDRYIALRDRFEQYKFEKIGKDEIIHYLKYFNNSLKNYSSLEMDAKKNLCINKIICSEDYFEKISDDIKLTYRTLHKILQRHRFIIHDVIDVLKNDAFNIDS